MSKDGFTTEELNKWVGRTKTPPDLLTLVDEHLRKIYQNVYAHPISPNDNEHWPKRELGFIMVMTGEGIFYNRMNIGTVYMDRVEWNVTTSNVIMSSADPSFFQKLIDFLDDSEYISEFIRRH